MKIGLYYIPYHYLYYPCQCIFFVGYILYKEKKVIQKQDESKSVRKKSAKNSSMALEASPKLKYAKFINYLQKVVHSHV